MEKAKSNLESNMMYRFKQKEWEKLYLISIVFKINYWLLKKVGLILFRGIYFLFGVLATVIIYEYLLR